MVTGSDEPLRSHNRVNSVRIVNSCRTLLSKQRTLLSLLRAMNHCGAERPADGSDMFITDRHRQMERGMLETTDTAGDGERQRRTDGGVTEEWEGCHM